MCLLHCPWLIVSRNLTDQYIDAVPNGADKPNGRWHCEQYLGRQTDEVGAERVHGGAVCDLFDWLYPRATAVIPTVLLVQGILCLALAPIVMLLLRVTSQPRHCASFCRCGSLFDSFHSLLSRDLSATAADEARFAGYPNDLISGQPKEAATGIYGFIGYEEAELRMRCLGGTAAIIKVRQPARLSP
jgi:hypothetical protein